MNVSPIRKARFGVFEVDFAERELRKRGVRVRLEGNPFRILEVLLERAGAIVTREELAQRLWPGLHVSFDSGLNTAINALREALGDSARNSRYIETRPRVGYRFAAPVELLAERDSLPRSPAGEASRANKLASNFGAHEDYIKGRYFQHTMRGDDLRRSVAHFESAIRQDPHCAAAYAGLADAHLLSGLAGELRPEIACQRARECIEIALEMDNRLAEPHVSRADIARLFDWDWKRARQECLRALELNSELADAHRAYAALLSTTGDAARAIEESRRALELDPLSIAAGVDFARQLHMAGHFHEAVEQCWKNLAMDPRSAAAQHILGLAYEQSGMKEEAAAELNNACLCSDRHPMMLASLAHAYAMSGMQREARDLIRELERAQTSGRYVSPFWIGIAQAGLGATEAALACVETAWKERDVYCTWLRWEPRYGGLRKEQRFQKIVDSVFSGPRRGRASSFSS